MAIVTYIIYPPPERGMPFLFVGLMKDHVISAVTAKTKADAERMLQEVTERYSAHVVKAGVEQKARGRHELRKRALMPKI